MKAAIWVRDSVRAMPRYLLVLAAVSALALLARAAAPSVSSLSAPSPSDLPASASPAVDAGASAVAAYVPGSAVSAAHAGSGPADATFAGSLTAHGPTAWRAAAYPRKHDALIAALPHRAPSITGRAGALRHDEVSPSAAARFNIGPSDPSAAAAGR